MSEIIVEPDAAIEESIFYLASENRIKYDGSSDFNSYVVDKLIFIKITLVNIRGEESEEFQQAVYIESKTNEEAQSSEIE